MKNAKGLLQEFSQFVKRKGLFSNKPKILLACSGGADSMVLADLFLKCNYDFSIAHCNFQLRGDESDGDEEFVRNFCSVNNIPIFVSRFDTELYKKERAVSTQMAARELRYAWFKELMAKEGFDLLATAHHADDNAETVLMNFFRGTGLKGVTGIDVRNGDIVRPLLFASKENILDYARENNLKWCEDSSNASTDYSRNALRNEIIPVIKKYYPEIIRSVNANAVRFASIEAIYNGQKELYLKKLIVKSGQEIKLPIGGLKKIEGFESILFDLVSGYGFTSHQLPELIELLDAESGKNIFSGSHRIINHRQWLYIQPLTSPEPSITLLNGPGESFTIGDVEFYCEEVPADSNLSDNENEVLVDGRDISFPIIVRKRREGDYFYPLGMRKKKKIGRFLSDNKIDPITREKILILESDQRIIWVAGQRIDDRFKVVPGSTKYILRFRLSALNQKI